MKFKYPYTTCLVLVIVCFMILAVIDGCSEAETASYNLSKQADNFNIVRRITVIDCITGDILFEMSGKMSINMDEVENQLEITVEDNGTYMKHIIGLSDNVTYVLEDLNLGANDVNQYRYTINFNPNMWAPPVIENVD